VPRQDAYGRWISDDGLFYWDGTAWRPVGLQAPARPGVSVAQTVLIGAGFVLAIVLVLVVGAVIVMRDPEMQRSFCNGWNSGQNNSENLACPFHPSSP
jgi:hypothetical protein